MQETQVPPLGMEDPLEEEMATHSSSLAGVIPWTEEPGGLQSMGWQKSWTTEQLKNETIPVGRAGCSVKGPFLKNPSNILLAPRVVWAQGKISVTS